MRLHAAVRIVDSQTQAVFEDGEGRSARVEFADEDANAFDSFVNVIKRGASILNMRPEEVFKNLTEVRVSIPAVADGIVKTMTGTRIGLITTEKDKAVFLSEMTALSAAFDTFVPKEMVVSVNEEIDGQGRLMVAPDRDEIRDKVRYLLEYGAGALVVGFRNSGLNPVNEKTVKEYIESDYPRHYLGAVPVFISSDFAGSGDDPGRVTACLHNVYCWAGVNDTLSRMETYLRERKFVGAFLITHGNGSLVTRAGVTPLKTSDKTASHDRS
ncbi:MAG: hydantoinase/oxoprolinase N-terminal domain-containing protein [Pseudomonadota bacterium]